MKNMITVKNNKPGQLSFYLQTPTQTLYLFTEHYTSSVYSFFYNGRLESEIRSFKGWRKNYRLGKTISKIPMYIRYALKEASYNDNRMTA